MNRINVFVTLFLLFSSCGTGKIIVKEEVEASFLYIYAIDVSSAQDLNQLPELQEILQSYEVSDFFASWPNANHDTLDRIYEIHFKNASIPANITKELSALASIEKVEIAPYYQAEGLVIPDVLKGNNLGGAVLSSCPDPFPPVNDPYIVNNWVNTDALDLLEASCAWSITTGSSSVVVGIADTEFDVTHEDLSNQIINVWGTATPYCVHGTPVAGCVAAEVNNGKGIAGIGYNTSIAGYKVVHTTGCGGNPWPAIWQAFQDEVDVINVSWTGIGFPPGGVAIAAQQIVDGGTVLVVAAGNTPGSTSHQGYANIPGVVNVSGVDSSNEHGPTGHAHNAWVDVCAMSTNVTTTYPGNNYSGGWGTSFAAPQVAGVVGLILAVNPCLTPPEVEFILKSTTDPIADMGSFPGGLGTGRVNAYQAVKKAATFCIENVNIQANADYESYILCTRNVILSNYAELKLKAVDKVEIYDSFIVQPGTLLEINVNTNNQIDCN